ncbi:hypothetical protein H632_c1731p0 [Helicosporidium sp. ATCC 50920]|nr:hypothetical protein H632_c1731p0 [Helicosporidium sp. ATCC 50920]|eukprot:KDD73918.1 hypothetical protein H632_c1731p0 [Helicosporidium sp. ATCC 50920]
MARTTSPQHRQALGFFERHGNVHIYVANLIGYARVAFAAYAFAVALSSPGRMVTAYWLSFVCDELDGRFARMFNQTSTLGTVMDMVTDRVATSCLLCILCVLVPTATPLFLAILGLDIFSHWFQMYATLVAGAASHKDVHSSSAIIRTYYRHRLFMGACCICCEVLYLSLYLLAWPQWRAAWPVALPPALAARLPPRFAPDEVPAVALLALAALPGTVIKQVVNVVQLRTAAQRLVEYDNKRDGRRRG